MVLFIYYPLLITLESVSSYMLWSIQGWRSPAQNENHKIMGSLRALAWPRLTLGLQGWGWWHKYLSTLSVSLNLLYTFCARSMLLLWFFSWFFFYFFHPWMKLGARLWFWVWLRMGDGGWGQTGAARHHPKRPEPGVTGHHSPLIDTHSHSALPRGYWFHTLRQTLILQDKWG